jgi:hypothetical protein
VSIEDLTIRNIGFTDSDMHRQIKTEFATIKYSIDPSNTIQLFLKYEAKDFIKISF